MPEGPESKRMAEYLNKYFKNNIIIDINIIKGRFLVYKNNYFFILNI